MTAPSNGAARAQTATPRGAGDVDLPRYLPHLLNSVSAQMNERVAQELRTIDLPLAHWRFLAILRWRGACTLKDIYSWTVIDTSTASRAVKRLEEEGALERRWDTGDSRARRITITAQGEAVFERGWAIVSGFNAHLFAGLSDDEKERMTQLLELLDTRLGQSVWTG